MNWFELLPKRVAKRQVAWERAQKVVLAREAGATLVAIGRSLGVSRERARQLYARAKACDAPSPAEMYLADCTSWEFGALVARERRRWERERPRPSWAGGLTPAEFRERLQDAKRRKELRLAQEQRWWRAWQARQAAQAERAAQRAQRASIRA